MFTEKQSLAQLFWDPFCSFPLFNTIKFGVYVSQSLTPDIINIANKENLHVRRPVRNEVCQPIVHTIQDKHEGITL